MNTNYTPTEEDLTAYVLNEADDAQKKMIEEAVATQPATKALLEEIRATIELSEATFAGLKAEELSEKQRASVEAAVATVIPMPRRNNWKRVVSYAATIAIIGGISYSVVSPGMFRVREAARRATPETAAKIAALEEDIRRSESVEHSQLRRAPEDTDPEGQYRYRETQDYGIAGGKDDGLSSTVVSSPADFPDINQVLNLPEGTESQQLTYLASPDGIRILTNGNDLAAGQGIPLIKADEKKEADGFGFAQNVSSDPTKPTANAPVRIAASPAPVEEREQLEALGYLDDDANRQLLESRQQLTGVTLQDRESIVGGGRKDLNLYNESVKKRTQIAGVPRQDQVWRPAPQPIQPPPAPGTEAYERIIENKFKTVSDDPLSTFSIDVDTASYANVRRFLNQSQLPPADAVRIEEMINYFDYDYAQPTGDDPFSANIEVAQAPWNTRHKLVRVGLKGKEIVAEERPAINLVFLLDVSGSMNQPNKLPLLKQSLRLLTEQLTANDRVAIAVYAGNSGMVLPSTPGNDHNAIIGALNRLNAGGSTNGGAGIELAYNVASQNFIEGGVNRVILATDGDFNVGTTNREALVDMIERKAKSGVFLSVLGYGMGNLKDATMEKLADKGNGNYAYIDTFSEAKKVLADEMSGTLFTIAKDVKIQVEFNPARVQAYRLVGYENRALANRDFNDDTKDAGEIGAGHTVTALYEIVPTGIAMPTNVGVDDLRYQRTAEPEAKPTPVNATVNPELANELMLVKLRYKQPDGVTSKLLSFPVQDVNRGFDVASTDFKFASAVATFGMKLRNSAFAQGISYDTVYELAKSSAGPDLKGYRAEFVSLVRQARVLAPDSNRYIESIGYVE